VFRCVKGKHVYAIRNTLCKNIFRKLAGAPRNVL
jgi:hypothetical protein